MHPSGMRADSRSAVPGTRIPGAPKPTDEADGKQSDDDNPPGPSETADRD